MSYRQVTPSVRRTNVPRDIFVEEPSGIKFIVNNKITIKYPANVVKWQKQLANCETLLFKAQYDTSLDINITSLKASISKYRRYLSQEGAYEDDLARNNFNSKAGNKCRGVIDIIAFQLGLNIDYEMHSKEEIVEIITNKFSNNQSAFVDMDLEHDSDSDSDYAPSVQTDNSEENRNNVRQMARQSYDYDSDDSTYIGSDSTVSTVTSADMDIDYQLV